MKSYVIATLIVVAAHVPLASLWSAYRGLVVNCGAVVSDGNDLADIPRQWLLGTAIVGMGWIVLANGSMAVVKKARARAEMLTIAFVNCGEVRMGSPYDVCDIELTGVWIPELPKGDWQNMSASSPNGLFVALVRWSHVQNEPGFQVFTIDLQNRAVSQSSRIEGCCNSLWWEGDEFKWRAFRLRASKP